MKWFGLTGGIASGKSTVAQIFKEFGYRVLDADRIARDVVAPGSPTLQRLVQVFGPEILFPTGALDRIKLGQLVFGNEEGLKKLNEITHPAIGARTSELLEEARRAGELFVIYDAALIVENGVHQMLDGLIVVDVRPEIQLQRLIQRDQISESDAQRRIRSQMPLEEKRKYADWIIDNNRDLVETRKQVLELIEVLKAKCSERPADGQEIDPNLWNSEKGNP